MVTPSRTLSPLVVCGCFLRFLDDANVPNVNLPVQVVLGTLSAKGSSWSNLNLISNSRTVGDDHILSPRRRYFINVHNTDMALVLQLCRFHPLLVSGAHVDPMVFYYRWSCDLVAFALKSSSSILSCRMVR